MKKYLFISLFGFLFVANSLTAATVHIVRPGDTLWDLAAKHYGDPTLYSVLVEVNHVTNPRTIQNGARIVIPDKSDMQAIARETDPKRRKELIDRANGGSSGDNNSSEDKFLRPKNDGSRNGASKTSVEDVFGSGKCLSISSDELKVRSDNR